MAQHRLGRFALADLRICQPPDDRHPVGRAQQIEAESPEVTRVGSPVAMARMTGKVGAFHFFSGLAAGHRDGVDQPCDLARRGCVSPQFKDDS